MGFGRPAQLAIELTEKGAADAAGALDRVGSSAATMGDKVASAGKSAEKGAAGLDKTAGAADEVASKGSQAAGAMGGLGSLIGGPFGAAMATGGVGLQAMADSGDLLNAALENSVVESLRAKAATVGKTIADKASAVATRTMTIAQKALNLAQKASPILLIVAGVLLLVGAVVLAYKKSDTFRKIVDKAMAVARAGVAKVVDAFKALGPIVGKVASFIGKVVSLYVGVYVKAFKLSLVVVKAVWNGISDAVRAVYDKITDGVGVVRDKLASAWRTIRDKGVAAFKVLTDPVQRLIDLVKSLLDKIASIHIPSFHIPGTSIGFGGGSSGSGAVASGSTTAPPAQVVSIQVTIQGGATPDQADQFMQAIDDRLRSKGKSVVFA
jgi:hypothetical protein